VLKKVRKSRTLGVFILGTYMVQHGGYHNRCGIVLVHDDLQAIVQGKFLELDFGLSG
jgi:hypothetical protein